MTSLLDDMTPHGFLTRGFVGENFYTATEIRRAEEARAKPTPAMPYDSDSVTKIQRAASVAMEMAFALGQECGIEDHYGEHDQSNQVRKKFHTETLALIERLFTIFDAKAKPLPPVAEPSVNDELSPEDTELLRLAIDDFEECGETSVDYEDLMRFANMGLLECSHFNVTEAAEIVIERAEAAKKGQS